MFHGRHGDTHVYREIIHIPPLILVASCILSMVNLEIVITVRVLIDMYSHECLEDFELCLHWAKFGDILMS